MKCWICEREMDELKYVKGDYICNNCGGTYFKEGSCQVFRDINNKIISKPLWDENDE